MEKTTGDAELCRSWLPRSEAGTIITMVIEENKARRDLRRSSHPPSCKLLLTHVCLMCFFNLASSGDPPASPGHLLQCPMTPAVGKFF